jgi:hypothetical protein
VSVRIPIPATPAALLHIAECLDRMWAAAEAAGHVRLSLEEEFRFREQRDGLPK